MQSSPAHVLYIIDELCGAGGAEHALWNIGRFLPKDRFCSSVVTFRVDSGFGKLKTWPTPVHHIPLQGTLSWSAARAAWSLRALLRAERVALVHTFFETSDLWGGLIARLSGCPVLVSSRRDMGILRSARHRVAYRLGARIFTQVHTVSNEVRRFVIEQDRLPREKVVTVHNGVDLDEIDRAAPDPDLRSRFAIPASAPLIATLGNLRRIKGADVLIRAAARVCLRRPDARFVIFGETLDAGYVGELRSLAAELGVARAVCFAGPTSHPYAVLKSADIFCLPSRSEGFSNALIEAMACRLPVIATRVGGNPEAVEDAVTGLLTDSEDSDIMADRILLLLSDPAAASRMGEAARRAVEERFSAQAMAETIGGHYDALLGLHPHDVR